CAIASASPSTRINCAHSRTISARLRIGKKVSTGKLHSTWKASVEASPEEGARCTKYDTSCHIWRKANPKPESANRIPDDPASSDPPASSNSRIGTTPEILPDHSPRFATLEIE